MEEWRRVWEAPRYLVSNYGRVQNSITGRILKPGGVPYDTLTLMTDDGRKLYRHIHVLVAEAFICPRPPGYEVNHIDLDKRNNHASNLEWTTHGQNLRHASENDGWSGRQTNKRGVRVVETGEEFDSIRECSRAIGGDPGNIWAALNGRIRRHRGLTFEYLDRI